MDQSFTNVGAITMFVEELERTRSFYERVFGLKPIYEDDNAVAFGFENLVVNLLRRPEAHELIAPAAVAEPDSGSRFQLTVGVEDTDAVCAELGARGVELLNGPIDRPWGIRTAAFADPDGHVWEVAGKLRAEAAA
jgi:catechol 2,3-dioxygenase-like lactoylglutathione lyase family enzyme